MSSQIENYFIEPDSDIPVMIPMHMYANQPNPRLCLVNASDRYYTIRKDTVVGEAVSADSGITVFPGTVTLDISGTFFAFP
jgi:hypothetical protein